MSDSSEQTPAVDHSEEQVKDQKKGKAKQTRLSNTPSRGYVKAKESKSRTGSKKKGG